jgi:putative acetyltransferase
MVSPMSRLQKSLSLAPIDPFSRAAEDLLALADTYLGSLYPPESNHLESPEGLSMPHVFFLGLRLGDQVIGCGAIKLFAVDEPPYGEIKRVFLIEKYRGQGYSKGIIAALEQTAKQRGIDLIRLETGVLQTEALGLYRRLGYQERGPYGNYETDPLSVFMEKRLS